MTDRFLPTTPALLVVPGTDATMDDAGDDGRSALAQALPLLLPVSVRLGLMLAFVAGQWLATANAGVARRPRCRRDARFPALSQPPVRRFPAAAATIKGW